MKPTLIAFLAACASSTTTSTHPAALSGAAPDDGVDDRVAIQALIDAAGARPEGGTVLLAAGRWTLTRAPIGSGAYNTHAALATHGHNVTLRGVGPETVLELVGDQGAQSVALLSIDPGAEHIRIADLTLRCRADSDNPCVNTDEQTHAIATSGVCAGATCRPIRDVKIENVRCDWPRDTPARKGDCVRLLGNNAPTSATATSEAAPGTQVYGVRIEGGNLEGARSAVMIQRGVYDVAIVGNTLRAGKTCIDGEATGGGTDERITIMGNTMPPGCSPAISLTNTNVASVTGNVMAGAITVYRSTGVAIGINSIDHAALDNSGTIDVANLCDGLAIGINSIRRTGAAGPVIKVQPHSGVPCQGFTIGNNGIRQTTAAWGIYLESASNYTIKGNQLTFTGAPSYSAIYERSVMAASPVTGVVIEGNDIAGPLTYGVQLHASPGSFGAGVSVHDNPAPGATFGLYLNNPAGFTAAVRTGD